MKSSKFQTLAHANHPPGGASVFYLFGVVISALVAGAGVYYALQTLLSHNIYRLKMSFMGTDNLIDFTTNDFSSLFLPVLALALLPILWEYVQKSSRLTGASVLSGVFFPLFTVGSLAVVTAQSTFSFLITWELMSASSFMLFAVSTTHSSSVKAAGNYVVQMHLAFFMLAGALLTASLHAGTTDISEALKITFVTPGLRYPVFLLLMLGLGFKLGLLGFHTWVPKVYEHAPGTVVALMTGVSKTVALYFVFSWSALLPQQDFYAASCMMIAWGAASAAYGALKSATSIKFSHVLAYSTTENMGLAVMMGGMAILGMNKGPQSVQVVAAGAGVLHAFNHAFFKPALILIMGKIKQGSGTDNLNLMGGMVKKAPLLAVIAVLASVSAAGLPPLGGFLSKFMIFKALFEGFAASRPEVLVPALAALIVTAFVSGLTVFAFVRLMALVFLGHSRRPEQAVFIRSGFPALMGYLPVFVLAMPAVLFFYSLYASVAGNVSFVNKDIYAQVSENLADVLLFSLVPPVLILLLFGLKKIISPKPDTHNEPVWGCGYTGSDATFQYTASSFSDNLASMTRNMSGVHLQASALKPAELFPNAAIEVTRREQDTPEVKFIDRLLRILPWVEGKVARIQTGDIRDYLLYGLLFIILLFVLVFID